MRLYRTFIAIILGSLGLGMVNLAFTPGSGSDPVRAARGALTQVTTAVEQGLGQTRAFVAGVLDQGWDGASAVMAEVEGMLGDGAAVLPQGVPPRAPAPDADAGGSLAGPARVIDGDTIEVGGTRVRLRRIDAPETRQVCYSPGGPWACGRGATEALASWVAGRTVRCVEQGLDRYGRVLGDCFVDDIAIGEAMVAQGWAMAWPGAGLEQLEDQTRQALRGIWSGRFVPPWEWRRGARVTGSR
ncbi:MAG: thermonuclease family protein [Alphaproteobacteria bacterium]|nr:thermonuclease family protein [Alphaproteobacteria bacterium]